MAEKPYKLERIREPGRPEIGTLLSATIAEFVDNLGPYAIAGVGQMLVLFPLIFVSVFAVYLVMGVVFTVGFIGSAVASEAVGGDAGDMIMLGGNLVTMAATFGALFAVLAALGALVAPMSASLQRAVAAHQRGDAKLEFSATFSTFSTDLVPVILVNVIVAALVTTGLMFCYIPGLIVAFVLGFAAPLVALHRKSPVEALRAAVAGTQENLGFHAVYFLVMILISLFAANLPVIGPMFIVALQVRAVRELYGDGDPDAFIA